MSSIPTTKHQARRIFLAMVASAVLLMPATQGVPSHASKPDRQHCAVSADAAERRAADHGNVCRV
jgi:hypothetical protein